MAEGLSQTPSDDYRLWTARLYALPRDDFEVERVTEAGAHGVVLAESAEQAKALFREELRSHSLELSEVRELCLVSEVDAHRAEIIQELASLAAETGRVELGQFYFVAPDVFEAGRRGGSGGKGGIRQLLSRVACWFR